MMKTLIFTAMFLLAASELGLAAQKARSTPGASQGKPGEAASTSYNAWRVPAFDERQGTSRSPFGAGKNLPYPDRPYGDPGRW